MRLTAWTAGLLSLLLLAGLAWPVPLDANAPVQRAPGRVGQAHSGRPPGQAPLNAENTVLAFAPPPIQARAAILIDESTGRVLYAKNADRGLPMASTTKITTAALALAYGRLHDLVRVSKRAATVGESTMALVRGERVTVEQLLYGLLLNSGNDAAVALAEHVSGSVSRFVRLMNSFARALHLRHTHYATPHGLDAPHHYSSARDLAIVAQYALRNPIFRQIVRTTSYHIAATRHNHEHWLANINRVMYWYPGVDGVKPGDTDAAGLCQVVSDWRDGHHLLAVLLNTPTLWVDIRNLLNYGARDFRWVQAPVWSDSPANSLVGGAGHGAWAYFLGSGHFVRGSFLHYFRRHGGLTTLGYPRTEPLGVQGRLVQFFQGAELVVDPIHRSVYPEPLGQLAARVLAPRVLSPGARVTHGFAGAYTGFGGRAVLGPPVSQVSMVHGVAMQFFRYGVIAEVNGVPALVPVGDLILHRYGWLRTSGVGDAYPSTLAPSLAAL